MRAFLTGSRCYGTPSEDSDIDVVIFCDEMSSAQDIALFRNLKDNADEIKEYSEESASFRYGSLNLIVTRCPKQYAAWLTGTRECTLKAPVDRETAKEVLIRNGVH